jgi:hypothetical protein
VSRAHRHHQSATHFELLNQWRRHLAERCGLTTIPNEQFGWGLPINIVTNAYSQMVAAAKALPGVRKAVVHQFAHSPEGGPQPLLTQRKLV